jgi:dipeptidyl aminopeptidase/acylaminoacyl peptidase
MTKLSSSARRIAVIAAAAAVVSSAIAAAAQAPAKRSIALTDLARIRTVGGPQISPDGLWIAYTLGSTDVEKDKRDTDLWMVSRDGLRNVRLTFGPEDGESVPRWSPDGRCLAFLASRGTEEEKKKGAQVWRLDRSGGEAEKLTDIKGGVSDYAWSPDGKRLVLVVSDADSSDDPEKLEGWKRKTPPPVVLDRYHFKQDREGYLKRLRSHLRLFDVAARRDEPLTAGDWDDESPSWSPDGARIAFVSARGPDPDRSNNTDIYVVEARAGAEARPLTRFPGPDDGRPSWSPDGLWIAYLQGDDPKYSAYNQSKLAVVSAEGGEPRLLTASLDRGVSGPLVWSEDGLSLTFLVEDDRAVYAGRVAAAGGAVAKLTSGRRTLAGISAGPGGSLALLAGTSSEIAEVHILADGALRKLTGHNDTLLAELRPAISEDFTSRSKDGTIVNGLMVKPADYKTGQKYPTLLYIHGGPNGQDDYAFNFDAEFFAATGYVVLTMNYRGSSGRGSAFQKAIFGDWGRKEVADLLGAVDQAVAAGVADPDRLGIGGWSYGGILTDYAIATDPRFKAAVSGAGSALQLSMYGSDQYIAQYEQEIGPPWKARDAWLRVSYPFFQADRIRTPTLFMGGEKDFNVPIAGSEQMYQALKSLGVETQLVVYPGQYHGLTVPSYQRDRLTRFLAWFDKHLKK